MIVRPLNSPSPDSVVLVPENEYDHAFVRDLLKSRQTGGLISLRGAYCAEASIAAIDESRDPMMRDGE